MTEQQRQNRGQSMCVSRTNKNTRQEIDMNSKHEEHEDSKRSGKRMTHSLSESCEIMKRGCAQRAEREGACTKERRKRAEATGTVRASRN